VAREGRANVARDLWTPKRTGASQLGGGASPTQVAGHLCTTCADAVEAVGSIGASALERALVAALVPSGIGKLSYGNLRVDGLFGWGALAAHAWCRTRTSQDPSQTRSLGSTSVS
jgi:hypothetical protein